MANLTGSVCLSVSLGWFDYCVAHSILCSVCKSDVVCGAIAPIAIIVNGPAVCLRETKEDDHEHNSRCLSFDRITHFSR